MKKYKVNYVCQVVKNLLNFIIKQEKKLVKLIDKKSSKLDKKTKIKINHLLVCRYLLYCNCLSDRK